MNGFKLIPGEARKPRVSDVHRVTKEHGRDKIPFDLSVLEADLSQGSADLLPVGAVEDFEDAMKIQKRFRQELPWIFGLAE